MSRKVPLRTLVVLPDDGIAPVVAAINAAQKSIYVKMFLFSEPRLLRALIAAHKRGVRTRVMLNPARRSGESENRLAKQRLRAAGIAVKDTHPDFDVTHEKSMVVDGEVAFVVDERIEQHQVFSRRRTKPNELVSLRSRPNMRVKKRRLSFATSVDRRAFGVGEHRIFRAPSWKGAFDESQNAEDIRMPKCISG